MILCNYKNGNKWPLGDLFAEQTDNWDWTSEQADS